jgi:hypothetical protein
LLVRGLTERLSTDVGPATPKAKFAAASNAPAAPLGEDLTRELMWIRRSRPPERPIHQHPLSASPLNDTNLMAGLQAVDRVDMKPPEQGGGVESL